MNLFDRSTHARNQRNSVDISGIWSGCTGLVYHWFSSLIEIWWTFNCLPCISDLIYRSYFINAIIKAFPYYQWERKNFSMRYRGICTRRSWTGYIDGRTYKRCYHNVVYRSDPFTLRTQARPASHTRTDSNAKTENCMHCANDGNVLVGYMHTEQGCLTQMLGHNRDAARSEVNVCMNSTREQNIK